ncbi:MAG: hypothetical protein LN413_03760 [Candidatus Thermoplasmatota archaeon]|nr:hypothetical protein [Candidatus Thermoplasmatota archaeon]
MLEASAYFRDWGPWGWAWAVGLFAFLLGLLLAPLAMSGVTPGALLFAPLPGAVLMRAAATSAGERASA